MNLETFKKHFEERNKTLLIDEQVDVEVRESDNKERNQEIDFLGEFIEVFGDYWYSYLSVEYTIGFITDTETVYISKEFLVFCIENKIIGEDADKFYHYNLDLHTEGKELSYKDTLKLMNEK